MAAVNFVMKCSNSVFMFIGSWEVRKNSWVAIIDIKFRLLLVHKLVRIALQETSIF